MPSTGKDFVLHYYPGHYPPTAENIRGTGAQIGPGLLVVLDRNVVLFRAKAYGGPSKVIKDPRGGPNYTPTPAGEYVLLAPEPYRTETWPFSEIKWGTPIKPSPQDPSDVWYLAAKNAGVETWASLKKDWKISREDVANMHFNLYGVQTIAKTWVYNAFGPIAVRFFKDLNGNGRLDPKTEQRSGAMFHTTSENEAQTALKQTVTMNNSHGCIHLKPSERDHLISIKALAAGVKLVIYPYEKKYAGAN